MCARLTVLPFHPPGRNDTVQFDPTPNLDKGGGLGGGTLVPSIMGAWVF